MVKICKCAAAILLKSGVPVLYNETSNLKNRTYSRGDFKKLKYVGGP
jgi:hypothetical protein